MRAHINFVDLWILNEINFKMLKILPLVNNIRLKTDNSNHVRAFVQIIILCFLDFLLATHSHSKPLCCVCLLLSFNSWFCRFVPKWFLISHTSVFCWMWLGFRLSLFPRNFAFFYLISISLAVVRISHWIEIRTQH